MELMILLVLLVMSGLISRFVGKKFGAEISIVMFFALDILIFIAYLLILILKKLNGC